MVAEIQPSPLVIRAKKQARRNGFHEFARQKADLSFEALIPKAEAVLAPPGPVIRVMPNMKLVNVRTV